MDDDQQFCLRWNNHQSTLISVFDTLLENETLVDCTLAAEGKFLKAHKVVLSACSPYFATLLQEQYDKHPIFILKDVKYQELRAMMDYMYRGEVNISQDQLAALLKAAESLQIKGLSDNRTGGGSVPKHEQPQQQQHRGMGLAGSAGGGLGVGKHVAGGYTLEQTKRARLGPASIDSQELSGSREGSSSPTSRRRRKVRRRSIDNVISAADVHDNSNSSQIQPIATTSSILQQQSNASLSGVGAIAAAASALASQVPASVAAALPTATAASSIAGAVTAIQPGTTQQQLTAAAAAAAAASTSVTKKTESVKGSGSSIVSAGGDAMHGDLLVNIDEQQQQLAAAGLELKSEKQNHKQQKSVLGKDVSAAGSSVTSAELVIEPKSEYDEEGNDENVEDLTLDDEDMGMEDLDHNAGTSHGNEGSSQGYAQWQHDRSQDEVFMATQDAQQRDPQVKHDKSEQTDISPDDFELDDCLLESNDIVITQNKDGFVLHVKKLGNITTAKIAGADDEQSMGEAAITGQAQITDVQDMGEVKPTLTTLTTSQTIKLPSSECELINLKKIIPATTTIAHHPHHTTIIQPHQLQQHHQQTQQQHHHIQIHDPHQQQTHEVQQQQQHHIVTTSHHPQTINVIGMRNVQITEQKPMLSRIKYSRGKIITQQGGSTPTVQIVEAHEHPDQLEQQQHHDLTDGTKYEISEIDLNNAQTSAAIISDLVKYAEIDDIELPDGTKIGIGFAPTEIAEHMEHQQTTQLEGVEHVHEQQQEHHLDQQQQHHQLQLTATQTHLISQHQQQQQQQQQHHQVQNLDQDDETIIPDSITVQEYPSITKSYTILTTRPMKQDLQAGGTTTTTTTYELSLSDSSMGQSDDIESKYVCRHCGKKYRWKSTLRRHENVECGGKEPCHPCPHCSYKAKQRGNLGVHVRKHHPDKPQLESKRGRKV